MRLVPLVGMKVHVLYWHAHGKTEQLIIVNYFCHTVQSTMHFLNRTEAIGRHFDHLLILWN